MHCPYCGGLDTRVRDSRPADDAIRRRRVCPDCGGKFTTFERVQQRQLTVAKRSGRRVPFDRDKLHRSIAMALRKRPVDAERIEGLVHDIVRQVEGQGEGDVASQQLGELVMAGLKALDDVAYVRYASVYRDFRKASDFGALIGELAEGRPGAAPERGRTSDVAGTAADLMPAAGGARNG